jgi:hypothetical protein
MRGLIERPYLGVDVLFQLNTTETGFSLSLGVAGRPRSARLLRHLAFGAIRAAQRFSRGADEDSLKLYAETIGDRSTVSARYREPPAAPSRHNTPARTKRPSRSFRVSAQTNLSEQVERILNRSTTEPPAAAPRRTSNPPPGMTHSSPPPPLTERNPISGFEPGSERVARARAGVAGEPEASPGIERPPPRRDGSITLPPSPLVPNVTLRENEQGDMEEIPPSDRPTPVSGTDNQSRDQSKGQPSDQPGGQPSGQRKKGG